MSKKNQQEHVTLNLTEFKRVLRSKNKSSKYFLIEGILSDTTVDRLKTRLSISALVSMERTINDLAKSNKPIKIELDHFYYQTQNFFWLFGDVLSAKVRQKLNSQDFELYITVGLLKIHPISALIYEAIDNPYDFYDFVPMFSIDAAMPTDSITYDSNDIKIYNDALIEYVGITSSTMAGNLNADIWLAPETKVNKVLRSKTFDTNTEADTEANTENSFYHKLATSITQDSNINALENITKVQNKEFIRVLRSLNQDIGEDMSKKVKKGEQNDQIEANAEASINQEAEEKVKNEAENEALYKPNSENAETDTAIATDKEISIDEKQEIKKSDQNDAKNSSSEQKENSSTKSLQKEEENITENNTENDEIDAGSMTVKLDHTQDLQTQLESIFTDKISNVVNTITSKYTEALDKALNQSLTKEIEALDKKHKEELEQVQRSMTLIMQQSINKQAEEMKNAYTSKIAELENIYTKQFEQVNRSLTKALNNSKILAKHLKVVKKEAKDIDIRLSSSQNFAKDTERALRGLSGESSANNERRFGKTEAQIQQIMNNFTELSNEVKEQKNLYEIMSAKSAKNSTKRVIRSMTNLYGENQMSELNDQEWQELADAYANGQLNRDVATAYEKAMFNGFFEQTNKPIEEQRQPLPFASNKTQEEIEAEVRLKVEAELRAKIDAENKAKLEADEKAKEQANKDAQIDNLNKLIQDLTAKVNQISTKATEPIVDVKVEENEINNIIEAKE